MTRSGSRDASRLLERRQRVAHEAARLMSLGEPDLDGGLAAKLDEVHLRLDDYRR